MTGGQLQGVGEGLVEDRRLKSRRDLELPLRGIGGGGGLWNVEVPIGFTTRRTPDTVDKGREARSCLAVPVKRFRCQLTKPLRSQ